MENKNVNFPFRILFLTVALKKSQSLSLALFTRRLSVNMLVADWLLAMGKFKKKT